MSGSGKPDDNERTSDARASVRAEFDWSEVAQRTTVVETVAIAADREPTGLEPLYGAIDPDALDAFIRSMEIDSTAGDAPVTFSLDGYQVTVRRGGSVVVLPDEPPKVE